MQRSVRILFISVATVLVVGLVVAFGWSRLGDSPTSAASDADDELAGPDTTSTPPVGAGPIDPIDPRTLDISLEIDRTRAPLSQAREEADLDLSPTSTDAQLLLINARSVRHDFAAVLDATAADLAVESLRVAQGIPLRPSGTAFCWFQLGFVLFEGGDDERAIDLLDELRS